MVSRSLLVLGIWSVSVPSQDEKQSKVTTTGATKNRLVSRGFWAFRLVSEVVLSAFTRLSQDLPIPLW